MVCEDQKSNMGCKAWGKQSTVVVLWYLRGPGGDPG